MKVKKLPGVYIYRTEKIHDGEIACNTYNTSANAMTSSGMDPVVTMCSNCFPSPPLRYSRYMFVHDLIPYC